MRDADKKISAGTIAIDTIFHNLLSVKSINLSLIDHYPSRPGYAPFSGFLQLS
jgi:hypothetical protein